MPALITDEMLAAFAIEAAPDEIGPALKVRYEDLIDRVSLYLPFVPGERDEFWRRWWNRCLEAFHPVTADCRGIDPLLREPSALSPQLFDVADG